MTPHEAADELARYVDVMGLDVPRVAFWTVIDHAREIGPQGLGSRIDKRIHQLEAENKKLIAEGFKLRFQSPEQIEVYAQSDALDKAIEELRALLVLP